MIPAFNEQKRIVRMMRDAKRFLQEVPNAEVIVVDDGSTDGTVEVVMGVSRGMVKVVRLEKNSGKWAAMWEGVRVAKGEVVVLLDADGSVGFEQLWRIPSFPNESFFVGVMVGNVWLGSRFMEGAVVRGKGWVRRVLSRGYRWYVRRCFKWATRNDAPDDMQCPMKVFPKYMVEREGFRVRRFAGDFELCAVLLSRGGRFRDIPVEFHHAVGGSVKRSTIGEMAVETWEVARQVREKRKSIKASTF